MDKAAAEEPIPVPIKENKVEKEPTVKRKRKTKSHSDSEPPVLEPQVEVICCLVFQKNCCLITLRVVLSYTIKNDKRVKKFYNNRFHFKFHLIHLIKENL